MRISKAVITAASPAQRRLPLQILTDRDGRERPVLSIVLNEILQASIEEVCIVVCPGDADNYRAVLAEHSAHLHFVEQLNPRGYGHAISCARDFTARDPFLHLVSDHLWVGPPGESYAAQLIQAAEANHCSVSAVQPTREAFLSSFGAVGGARLSASSPLYQVDTVLEKPTPTEAEQKILVPGFRAGLYLCFFGMHVLTPAVQEILAELPGSPLTLSAALARLPSRERYLALQMAGRRYDLGARYGVLTAQLALALSGPDRPEILAQLVELLSATGTTA